MRAHDLSVDILLLLLPLLLLPLLLLPGCGSGLLAPDKTHMPCYVKRNKRSPAQPKSHISCNRRHNHLVVWVLEHKARWLVRLDAARVRV
jgi:hypothetical protein